VEESRRDPAQAAVLQVGTPSLGKSHCVRMTHAAMNASNFSQSGKLNFPVSFQFTRGWWLGPNYRRVHRGRRESRRARNL